MSKGPGRIQRDIVATFDREPDRRFTTYQLAQIVYGFEPTDWQVTNTARALRTLAPKLGLKRSRAGFAGKGGWQHKWSLAA